MHVLQKGHVEQQKKTSLGSFVDAPSDLTKTSRVRFADVVQVFTLPREEFSFEEGRTQSCALNEFTQPLPSVKQNGSTSFGHLRQRRTLNLLFHLDPGLVGVIVELVYVAAGPVGVTVRLVGVDVGVVAGFVGLVVELVGGTFELVGVALRVGGVAVDL